jgi:NodT family efflux transporter outer membrane factor (OMF) lipoprotein
MRSDRALGAVVTCALLAACVSPAERDAPAARPIEASSLESQRTLGAAPAGEWPGTRWWTVFGDSQLDRLVEEALAGSPTLRIARARVAQASALVDAAIAYASPGATAGLDVTRQHFSLSGTVPPPVAGTTRTTARLALDLTYELDYAGRNAAAIAAARAGESATGADAEAARIALSSAVARAYFQLQSLFALRTIAQRELGQAGKRVELTRQRFGAGLDTEAALSRAQSVPPELRANMAQLDAAVALARNQLAALTAKGPDRGLSIVPVTARETAQAALPSIPGSLPLDLLGRRPDLAAARWRAEAASREIEVARLRFLPNVNLLAFVGVASLGLDRLFAAGSEIGGVGPAIRLPIFSAGNLQAGLRGRQADYDLAVERYNELVIDAVREVADQVQTRRALESERSERGSALAATDRTHRIALDRYRAGLASYLDVLDAEAPLFGLHRAETDLRARALQAEVGLYRALGGGYEDGGAAPR